MDIKSVPVDVDLGGATLIGGVLADLEPAAGSEDLLGSVDTALVEAAGFDGKTGQVLRAPHTTAQSLLLIGLGDEVTFESLRAAIGNAVRAVKTKSAFTVLGDLPFDGAVKAVVEGAVLGSYRYRAYKTGEEDNTAVESFGLIAADKSAVESAAVGAEATNLVRDWVNTPAIGKSPEILAGLMAEAASGSGVDAEVWDEIRIGDERLGALEGVAAGSDRPPRLVTLTYRPEGSEVHLGLVGKGITFDSGGLSIKPSKSMETMKDDMAGAGVVVAATLAIARLGLPIRVTAVAPITDNAVGGSATRPGDVLRPVNGPTIEVLNTDAEGRLILADGLGVMQRHNPDLIIDIATLTGSAHIGLGSKIGAVFGSEPSVVSRVMEAASRAGEHFWEMPLFEPYRKALDSDVADIKNITGSRYGGAISAALFLREYAGDGPWAHLDIAGPARSYETAGEQVKGASGMGVRTLIEVARAMSDSG